MKYISCSDCKRLIPMSATISSKNPFSTVSIIELHEQFEVDGVVYCSRCFNKLAESRGIVDPVGEIGKTVPMSEVGA